MLEVKFWLHVNGVIEETADCGHRATRETLGMRPGELSEGQ